MIEEQFEDLRTYLREHKNLDAGMVPLASGGKLVTVRNVPLVGWKNEQADIVFLVPPGYPGAKPDCFWACPQVRLANGAIPQSANETTPLPVEQAYQRTGTWFSWHLQSWDPNVDSLTTFYSVISKRLMPAR
jgi:hypothetical protein